jgi:predicted nuclease of predicted toxin-antitoxin system
MQLSKYIYWVDANLPPQLAEWLKHKFQVEAYHLFDFEMLTTSDEEIFAKAKALENIVILTKDEDFADLVLRLKFPPYIIWITVGNTTNKALNKLIIDFFEEAVSKLIASDFGLIEIK